MVNLNRASPTVMYVDLNSCFAMVEQQANFHLRGKPVVVAAYTSPGGCILAASVEAKRMGIRTGMAVRDARAISPIVIVRDPDPALIRDVHNKFYRICTDYSPVVTPKSIDEVAIDFAGSPALNRGLVTVAKEIKLRLRREIGDWISCSIGIAPNRFLAKLAASLHKPDGLSVIDHTNLEKIYGQIDLTDLNGISTAYQDRLNAHGIFTPARFLQASASFLTQAVFASVVGDHWYWRLRGFEVDAGDWTRKSYGQDFALGKKTGDREELSRYLLKLCEKLGRRMRHAGQAATGLRLHLIYADRTAWQRGQKFTQPLYSTQEIFTKASWIFDQQPGKKTVAKLSVSCYALLPHRSPQPGLFPDPMAEKSQRLSAALDKINDRYGEYTIAPALMMQMDNYVRDRIAFGAVR
ncbi:hypothetical protein M1523_03245 [Patescibacteria group bacterium]|nr:hypothetical protein [Patescibacteria group bacterium]MCL5091263.1 hypothetical protein [Patescibacteria group bacterium]